MQVRFDEFLEKSSVIFLTSYHIRVVCERTGLDIEYREAIDKWPTQTGFFHLLSEEKYCFSIDERLMG